MAVCCKTAPTKTTRLGTGRVFRVWCNDPRFDGDNSPWRCVAEFWYLGDALDFIASLQDRGVDCVFQSPAHTSEVKADAQRVVYKPPQHRDALKSIFEWTDEAPGLTDAQRVILIRNAARVALG